MNDTMNPMRKIAISSTVYFFRMLINVSLGIETLPNCFIFFFPSFCFPVQRNH
jgi:hypothetical protein